MAVKATGKDFYAETRTRLSTVSQLKLFNILKDTDNTKFLNIFKYYKVNEDLERNIVFYYTHEVGFDEWWDDIAYKYYENANIWWILPLINGITNPFEDLNEGDLIKILKPQFIYQVIKDIEAIYQL